FVDNNLSNISNNSTLGGVLKYRLVHSASFKQSVISSAYDDRISGIVNDKLSTYGFSTININDTGNQDIWYQPNKKDLEFIKNDLLPYAYSNNSDNTPFYFYIDATNTANFINYKTIKNNILNFKLTYGRQSENDELIAPLSIEKLTLGSKATKDLRYIKGIGLNLDGGIEEIEEQLISDIYSSKQGKSPVIFDPSIITKIIEMDEELEKGKQENNQGYLINLLAKVIGLEQFIVTIPYNSYVRAGTSIDFITNDSGKEFNPSINYTDNYIIEEVSSLWNGKIGLTKFIMSRNNLALDPSEFLIYNELGG
nr:hypothetical protein [Candidatus Woesearchaeota archaeon]